MELSIFAAQILSLTYISAGIAALSGKLSFRRLIEDFETSPGLTYMTGFITLILGMILVKYHNLWVKDWTVLITLIGWAALLKGLMLMACPHFISRFKGWYKNSGACGFLMIGMGIVFGYFGFFS